MLESPLLKGLVKRGYEVLMLDDSIDEYTVQTLDTFQDHKLVNIAKSGFELPLDEDEENRHKKLERYYQPLIDWLSTLLSEEIQKVSLSKNLVNDPMLILATSQGYSAHMENIIKAQTVASNENRGEMLSKMKKNLEINPQHPFIKELLDRVKAGADDETEESARLLFEISMLNSGFNLKKSNEFATRFYYVMSDSLGLSRDQKEVEIDLS